MPDYGEIPLQNGIYENEVQRFAVNFVDRPGSIAFGDLNKDGVEDAATLLVVNSGGSGSFVYLSVVINQLGTQAMIAPLFLGDRVKINSIAIAQDQITVDMIAHGFDEPLCCPSKKVTRVYKVQPQLVQVAEKKASSMIDPAPLSSASVIGTIAYREKIALPPGAVVTVKLLDVSLQDAPAFVIAEQTMTTSGEQVPIPFRLNYDPAAIKATHTYAIEASIAIGRKRTFLTTTSYPVITQGHPSEIEVVLEKIN